MAQLSADQQQASLNLPRARAILMGCALVLALAFVMPWVNLSMRKYDWAFRPLATGPLFVLFLLIWPLNTALKRWRPTWVFTGPELLLVYAMMAICAGLAYEGLWGYALYYSVYPFYGATAANRYAELLIPHLPIWLMVPQTEAVQGFFHSAPTWSWRLWLTPILGWSTFALSLYLFLFCLGAVVRKDWIESERLAFPLAAIPSELAAEERPSLAGGIFRSPYLWIGVAFPVCQSLLQMAHALAPAAAVLRPRAMVHEPRRLGFAVWHLGLHRIRPDRDLQLSARRGVAQPVALLRLEPSSGRGLHCARIRP